MTMTEANPATQGTEQVTAGRTMIASRALDRVVSAVTADALGTTPNRVGVDLTDDAGNLSLTVSTPIRVPSLLRIEHEPGVIDRQGGPLLERAKDAQEHIRTQVQNITGSTVARVIVKITGLDIAEERRVR